MKDLHAWLQKIRAPRYPNDGGTLFEPLPKEVEARTKVAMSDEEVTHG
jgi:hypothetical protein